MKVHLVDGTYELFRQHFGAARYRGTPNEFDATIGVLNSTLALIDGGATHLGVATDHEILSFRNDLYEGYKTGEDLPEELIGQIPLLEEALEAMGVTVWPMDTHEADDAIGAAAAVADADPAVTQVLIVSPDKDLAQCVRGERVVFFDRKTGDTMGHDGVVDKFGVPPESITDYLALVGDAADGFPGLPGWGAKSTAAVLARYGTIENIPTEVGHWDVPGLRGAARLATALNEQRDLALLFRVLATLDTEIDVGAVADWQWRGPTAAFDEIVARLDAPALGRRAERLAAARRPDVG
jgi:5'-3' exonuclease